MSALSEESAARSEAIDLAPGHAAQPAPSGDPAKGVIASAVGAVAQSLSADQLRGYANEAIGQTRIRIGLAVGSPELALLGMAQKALGQAQRYICDAQSALEPDAPACEMLAAARETCGNETCANETCADKTTDAP
ncbi:MAG: hypothetical protein ACR652_02015 [Methylocystis sp.]|uniref:hypothetical protein n=1 Tax=Methylocystis sp. TaxID=1911079 RepID=UPI003DA236BE